MSLLDRLKNKNQPPLAAIPAIPAIRGVETWGGIAGIARVAAKHWQIEKVGSANDEQPSLAKDELEAAVLRMARHYDYTETDLNFAMRDSARCPSDWKHLVCNDVHAPEFVSRACCAEWGHERNEGRATPLSPARTWQACRYESALSALKDAGYVGHGAEAAARAIAEGVTDESALVALLEGRT